MDDYLRALSHGRRWDRCQTNNVLALSCDYKMTEWGEAVTFLMPLEECIEDLQRAIFGILGVR